VTASSGSMSGSDAITVTAGTDGIWINTAGGSWGTGGNWQGGGIPSGSGYTADFSTLTLTANETVTLDGARTIGSLLFGDTAPYNWILNTGTGGTLTLSGTAGTPSINVVNQTATIGAVLSGTQGLVKSGSGTLALTSADTYTGVTTISAGEMDIIGGISSFPSSGIVNNGVMRFATSGGASGVITYAGAISGTGVFAIDTTAATDGARLQLQGSAVSNTDTWNIVNKGAVWLYSTTSGTYGSAMNVNVNNTGSGAYFGLDGVAGTVFNIGGLSGTGQVENFGGAVTLSVGNGNATSTYSGVMSGPNSLTKSGTGVSTLTGSNTYTGTTTVNAGILAVNGSIASSAVTVSGSGTLAGTGTTGAVTVSPGGTVAPGVSGTGALSLGNHALSLSGSGVTAMALNASTGANTKVQGISTVTYGGTLNVTNLAGTLAAGNAFTLFSAATYSGSFAAINLPSLSAGLYWNTSNLAVNGSISVVGQTLTTIAVAPATSSLGSDGTQQFTATGYDQFGAAMVNQPTFTWSNTGVGLVNGSGLYTGSYASGSATVKAASGSVNGSASVTVTDAAPTVASAAAASPSSVNGNTSSLSVLGADSDGGGESNLTYTWAATSVPPGAAVPTYSANGTNASKNTTATFSKAGAYTLAVTVTDMGGLTATSSVNVTVNQTLTSIAVAPATASLGSDATQQFSATGNDQFGNAMSSQPGFTWSNAGSGSVNSSGLYTASYASGSATVTASSGGVNGSASVTVTDAAPTVATAASAAPNPLDGPRTNLSVLGADSDGGGESNLTYTWAATVIPNGASTPIFSANGTNAAKNTLATVTSTGAYTFTVTIADAGGNTATSSANVTVNQLQLLWTGTGGNLNWSNGSNWNGGLAPQAGDQLMFTGSATDDFTAGTAFTALTLQGGGIGLGGNSLTLTSGTHVAIASSGTNNTIAQAIQLGSNATVSIVSGSLAMNGTISGTAGLTVAGAGTLTLSGDNTYSGATAINGGTLAVNGWIGNSAVTVNSGATLSGTGMTGAVSVAGGGNLAPGVSGTGSLSLNNNALSLSGSASMEINQSTGAATQVRSISSLTYGGTLNVANLSGTLAAGNTFTLFSSGTYNGSFSTLNLPALSSGLLWNTADLAVNGSIAVTGTLPSGWTSVDIGSVGVPGSSSYNGSVYAVNGSGAGIGGAADAFQLTSETLAGDGEIRAQVTSQTNTNASAKAGVMIRSGTGAGAINALVALTPASGFIFQDRTAVSGSTTVSGTAASFTAPNNWVRLTRSGTLISAYVSTSGTAWTQIGTAILSTTNSVSVGLAVTSASNTQIGTATFANVTVTPFPSPWQSVDIGSTGLQGSAEYYNSAYTLKGAGNIGSTADNYHFVYQSLTNSGTLSARISTFQNTGTNSRVGVMIRTSLTNNSQYAFMGVSGTGSFESQYRSATGGATTTTTSGSGTLPNLWVRIGRSSNTLTAYKSSNGTSWTLVKSISITMGTTIYIGFVDASGTTTVSNTSVFDNVNYIP